MNFPTGWLLPSAISERLGERSGRQRAMVAEGHLLLILHKVPEAEGSKRSGVFFWRSEQGEWHSGDGRRGIVQVREHLLAYETRLEQLEALYEASKTAQDFFGILEVAIPLHRAAVNQHTALQSAREGLPEARDIISLRDIAGEIERAAELLHADAKIALDYRVAQQTEKQTQLANELAQTSHRLNLMAALFLPASIVGGAFGTSLRSGLEFSSPLLFWVLLLGSLLVGGAIWWRLTNESKADADKE
jgi:hypothetical protein